MTNRIYNVTEEEFAEIDKLDLVSTMGTSRRNGIHTLHIKLYKDAITVGEALAKLRISK